MKSKSGPLTGLKTAHHDEPPRSKGKPSADPTKGLKEAIKAKQVALLALKAASLK